MATGDDLFKSNGIELRNGDPVYWNDINPYLTNINAKCGNNLTMVMATCFGLYILQDLIESFFNNVTGSQCPFLNYVGPESNAGVDDFVEAFPVFYKYLNESKSIQNAVLEMNKYTAIKFRTDNAWNAFYTCIQSFANNQIKNRVKYMAENTDLVINYYCELYYYTYVASCDMEAVMKIMIDEKFYVDYLNKRRKDFLHIKDSDDRFARVDNIPGFEKSVPRVVRRQ